MTAELTEATTYVMVLTVDDIFVDNTYQRPIDIARARKMAHTWDRRLAGVIEVSDRGEHAQPRYAVIDGQHRWAAARSLVNPPLIAANVHEGLSLSNEAALFDKLNRMRKKVNIFEHYKARLAAGDWTIGRIQAVLEKHGLRVDPAPAEGCIGCVGTLEKVADIDDALLDETLQLISEIWGRRRDALDAPIIHGLALILHHLRDDIDLERLVDALLDCMPRQLKTSAVALRDMQSGTLPLLTAIVMMNLYNKRPGRKTEVSARTFGGSRATKANDGPPPPFVRRYREMNQVGLQDWEVAQKMGIKLTSLVRQLERHNMRVDPTTAAMAVEQRAAS